MGRLQAEYPHRPIAGTQPLSKALGVSQQRLTAAAIEADDSYRLAHDETKSDGSVRQTFDADSELKAIQERIKRRLLNEVRFPVYLQGSIKDRHQPRHCLQNASLHVNAKTVITEDAANFFPSISAHFVRGIWLKLFGFTPNVARLLTSLTTRKGVLVQGAKTSPGLANLAFWDLEPELVQRFAAHGWRYSRYVDDISVSSKRRLDDEELEIIVGSIVSMFARRGCRINRRKHSIAHAGRRLQVNNLLTDSKQPKVSRDHVRKIRAAVNQFEWSVKSQNVSRQQIKKDRTSLLARVDYMARSGRPQKAEKLRMRVEQTEGR